MIHVLEDERVKCTSILSIMKVKDYISLVSDVYKDRGGLPNQRAPLKTKTAITIRKRMIDDIQLGAILPPIVIGILIDVTQKDQISGAKSIEDLLKTIGAADKETVSVIDGMQRTTAIMEAMEQNARIEDQCIRIEFWISTEINSLIYRMLVLNTGQVPWEIGRQLDTVYRPFIHKIKEVLADDIEVFSSDTSIRNRVAGQFQSDKLIELLLLFSSRKTELNLKDKIAEDFARLDMVESTSNSRFLEYFIRMLKMMIAFDKAVSRFTPDVELLSKLKRIKSGKDIVSSFPAMVGFCCALSVHLFDEPGFHTDWETIPARLTALEEHVQAVIDKINGYSGPELTEFIQAELLEEKLSAKSGQVGRYERDFFKRAFTALFNNIERIENLTPCWMAR